MEIRVLLRVRVRMPIYGCARQVLTFMDRMAQTLWMAISRHFWKGICWVSFELITSFNVLKFSRKWYCFRLEGRSWCTSHRGRLWIASTAQRTEKDAIQSVVDDYRRMYPGRISYKM